MRSALLSVLLLGGCAEELTSPKHSVDSVEPALVCNDQFLSTLTVNGKNLTPLPVDTVTDKPRLVLPHIEITKGSELDGSGSAGETVDMFDYTRWLDDATMEMDVDPDSESIPEGSYDITVTNPDEAKADAKQALAVVPPPVATDLVPDRVCLAQGAVDVELNGSGFLQVEGTLPTIDFGGQVVTPNSAEDCFDVVGPMDVQSCNNLPITLAQDLLSEGLYDVVLTNPEPAQCMTTEPITLQVFPPPTLASIEPLLECDDGVAGLTFALTGTGFLVIDGMNPEVAIGSWVGTASRMVDCSADPNGGADQICTGIEIDIPPTELAPGLHDVVVTNPPPVGCATAELVQVETLGPPTFDVPPFIPSASCADADTMDLEILGSGFVFLDAPYPGYNQAVPFVRMGSIVWTDDPSLMTTGDVAAELPPGTQLLPQPSGSCVALSTVSGQICDAMIVTIPAGTFPVGNHTVEVTNPPPAECATGGSPSTFDITNPPDITGVQPPTLCDNGQSFTIIGTDFALGAQVLLDTTDVETAGGTVTVANDGLSIDVSLPYGFGAGIYDVTVINVAGCEDTEPAALEIRPMPIVFFVDPPIIYNQIEIQATIYVSGINGGVQSVTLEEASTGTMIPITDFFWDPATPGRIQAVLPAGLAEGDYHVHIVDDLYCDPSLEDALFEEADLTVSIDAIDPPFGWDQDFTPVEITGTDPAGFLNVPRVYMNPVNSGGGTTLATELRGVDYKDGDTINAVVPSGLPVGDYDVIVVNPDGTIGLLGAGFQVVPEEPPVIDSVSPGTFPNSGPLPITIFGAGFLNPTVEATCVDPTNPGVSETLTITVDPGTSTLNQINGTFPADGLSFNNGVCIITVYSDYDDGTNYFSTWAEYAAVSITNPSQNLYPWQTGTDMNVARIAPATTAGRSTRVARNLYAIGGDDGNGTPYASVERAPVGQFGDLGNWSLLEARHDLPVPRTMTAMARWGRFIYLAGGSDGTNALDTVLKAEILDPLEAPRISSDLALELGTGTELGGGTYVYRVAALFDGTYDDNPNGESLPSDPFVVRVPARPERILLTMTWAAIPGASGYRVYRSDTGSGNETWYTDVPTNSFVDDGTAPDTGDPAFGLIPLPQGSLGNWHTLTAMPTTREGACAAIGVDPADPDLAYLYVAGGRADDGTLLDRIDYLPLSQNGDHDQDEAGAWATSAFNLPAARWQCHTFKATNDLHPSVTAGDTWMFFGAGATAGGINGDLDVLRVGPGGEFDMLVAGVSAMQNQAGYVYAAASDFLYSLGGGGGGPTTNAFSTRMCTAPFENGCGTPPELKNWNSLAGGALSVPRYLAGSAQESSVIFAIGGDDGNGATTSTEFTNY